MFWILYILISFLISLFISFFVKKRIFKILLFSFSLSLMISFWFTNPGDNNIAPIFSIFLLESTILEESGVMRLLRPLAFTAFLVTVLTFLLWKKNSKN